MKAIFAGLAVAAFSASVAFAVDDVMASRYGNTTVVKGADGKEVIRLYYDQGGAMSTTMADGKTTKGTWKLEGDKICITQTEPAPEKPEMATQCRPFSGAKNVGDTWEVPGPDGTKMTVTLQQGRP